MAIAENKQCHSCGLFWDCERCNGKHTPPCAELADKNFNSLQQLKAEISAIASEIEAHCAHHACARLDQYIIRLRRLSAV